MTSGWTRDAQLNYSEWKRIEADGRDWILTDLHANGYSEFVTRLREKCDDPKWWVKHCGSSAHDYVVRNVLHAGRSIRICCLCTKCRKDILSHMAELVRGNSKTVSNRWFDEFAKSFLVYHTRPGLINQSEERDGVCSIQRIREEVEHRECNYTMYRAAEVTLNAFLNATRRFHSDIITRYRGRNLKADCLAEYAFETSIELHWIQKREGRLDGAAVIDLRALIAYIRIFLLNNPPPPAPHPDEE